jgi:hypothetical protein
MQQVESRVLTYFSTMKMEVACFSETLVTFNGLHGVISSKLSITTAARTANPTSCTYCIFIHFNAHCHIVAALESKRHVQTNAYKAVYYTL